MSGVFPLSLQQASARRIREADPVIGEPPAGLPRWAEACRQELEWFVVQHRGSGAVVLSVGDGAEVAAAAPHPSARVRLAAMSGLLMSMCHGTPLASDPASIRHMVFETGDGMAVMIPVGDLRGELLLAVVAERSARPAPLLWTARQCCLRIRAAAPC